MERPRKGSGRKLGHLHRETGRDDGEREGDDRNEADRRPPR